MAYSIVTNTGVRLAEVLSKLKSLIARAEFLATKQQLNRKDKIILKLNNLLASPNSHYFNAETKLYISSLHISKADVQRIMEARGVKISRSGLEARLYACARQFVEDFGVDATDVLTTEQITPGIMLRMDAIELTLLNITTGVDYCDNNVDRLLKEHGFNVENINGFSSIEDVTQEQVDKFIELLEPYTKVGKAKRLAELNKLSHVLWYFRKASLDGSDDVTVNKILRSIL